MSGEEMEHEEAWVELARLSAVWGVETCTESEVRKIELLVETASARVGRPCGVLVVGVTLIPYRLPR